MLSPASSHNNPAAAAIQDHLEQLEEDEERAHQWLELADSERLTQHTAAFAGFIGKREWADHCRLNSHRELGWTVLHSAASSGDVAACTELLEGRNIPVDTRDVRAAKVLSNHNLKRRDNVKVPFWLQRHELEQGIAEVEKELEAATEAARLHQSPDQRFVDLWLSPSPPASSSAGFSSAASGNAGDHDPFFATNGPACSTAVLVLCLALWECVPQLSATIRRQLELLLAAHHMKLAHVQLEFESRLGFELGFEFALQQAADDPTQLALDAAANRLRLQLKTKKRAHEQVCKHMRENEEAQTRLAEVVKLLQVKEEELEEGIRMMMMSMTLEDGAAEPGAAAAAGAEQQWQEEQEEQEEQAQQAQQE
eukprot:g2849.t1